MPADQSDHRSNRPFHVEIGPFLLPLGCGRDLPDPALRAGLVCFAGGFAIKSQA